ncbi:MAG: 1-(5-phosphoribosyl)-5-[(5-phosphoribosylamino)methylideneamino]imidazole-4-carboxamide isomerase [Verrucomicrobiota bacterium JB022]|nr:1-(5-phosphoribosyl)-5-[(5-phosphoribosylamino)methylideneamino]imidazole-4-carboxamide isomerase [Verrucomicrobiota bacterium JB022]
MELYPAIDLMGGEVVRLTQGKADQKTVYYRDPLEPARQWQQAGTRWLHVVDLDGAFTGTPGNLDAIERILGLGLKVELGGGLRDSATVQRVLDLGVQRVIIGTKAAQDEGFIAELVETFGGDRIAVGIDARDGKVAIKGWVDVTEVDALEMGRRMGEIGVGTLIYTDISRDGMMTGPNFAAQEAMLQTTKCRVIASGGVSQPSDIPHFREIDQRYDNLEGVIIGKALYEGTVRLEDVI